MLVDAAIQIDGFMLAIVNATMGSYGVCDSPDQMLQIYQSALHDPGREFLVMFTKVVKIEQPSSGGWRWHK